MKRPFLGPLYKFMVLHPRESMRRVPSFVSFILHFLTDQGGRHKALQLCRNLGEL